MRTELVWEEKSLRLHKKPCKPLWDLAFSPDGTKLLVTKGLRVLLFQTDTGTVLHSISGTGVVNGVAWSRDGKKFATGSTDSTVVI